jgi:hypothetical protein
VQRRGSAQVLAQEPELVQQRRLELAQVWKQEPQSRYLQQAELHLAHQVHL